MNRKEIKKIIKEALTEAYFDRYTVEKIAFNKERDLSNFNINDVVKGFNAEFEKAGGKTNPETIFDIVLKNLNLDSEFYGKNKERNIQSIKKKVNETEESNNLCHKLIIKKGVDNIDEEKLKLLKKFISFVSGHLKLDTPCRIFLSAERNNHLETTASYNRNNNDIWIYVKNRNMLGDILRSIAHEMMHLKQNILGQLNHLSGEDGSPQENEANSFSGLMIRKFGRENRKIYQ